MDRLVNVNFGLKLCRFLIKLIKNLADMWPVEANPGRPFRQLLCAQQTGQGTCNAIQRTLRLVIAPGFLTPFSGFLLFPVPGLGLCVINLLITKNMRVTPDHLVSNAGGNIIEAEQPRFFGNPGVIDDLQQQIAQFISQGSHILLFNRISHFIGFFDRVGGDGLECLFDIPRTTCFRVTQAYHDVEQTTRLGQGHGTSGESA